MTLTARIERIQRTIGVDADGIIGVETVSALERALGIVAVAPQPALPSLAGHLVLSRIGLDELVMHEITSESYYAQHLTWPTWPGGASGVTIGIGYDLGYRSKAAVRTDWEAHLPGQVVAHLCGACAIRGSDAKGVARSLKQAGVRVPLATARLVFYTVTMPEFAALTRATYPGTEKLPPDAQAALVSLVYNRGASLQGPRRVEMASIKAHVKRRDLEAIAREIESMKRLWVGQGLDGLLRRRDREAGLVRQSARSYQPEELVYI
jgi:hypothetical protein